MSDIYSTVRRRRDLWGDNGYTGVEVEVGPSGLGTVTFFQPEPVSKDLTASEVRELRDYLSRTLEDNARAAVAR